MPMTPKITWHDWRLTTTAEAAALTHPSGARLTFEPAVGEALKAADGRRTVDELARAAGLTPAALHSAFDRLADRGLVERLTPPTAAPTRGLGVAGIAFGLVALWAAPVRAEEPKEEAAASRDATVDTPAAPEARRRGAQEAETKRDQQHERRKQGSLHSEEEAKAKEPLKVRAKAQESACKAQNDAALDCTEATDERKLGRQEAALKAREQRRRRD